MALPLDTLGLTEVNGPGNAIRYFNSSPDPIQIVQVRNTGVLQAGCRPIAHQHVHGEVPRAPMGHMPLGMRLEAGAGD